MTLDPPAPFELAEVEKHAQRVLARSNYYSAKATQFSDAVIFGTAPMLIYEDAADVIRCVNLCMGEYLGTI